MSNLFYLKDAILEFSSILQSDCTKEAKWFLFKCFHPKLKKAQKYNCRKYENGKTYLHSIIIHSLNEKSALEVGMVNRVRGSM